jgi:hypothetical protein
MAWSERDSLVPTIVMRLWRGLKLCHGMRRRLTEPEQFKIGTAIADELKLSNCKIEHGPPLRGMVPGGGSVRPSNDPHKTEAARAQRGTASAL